jgi:hypothetical protein
VLRLATVPWRLRRATTIETGLFEIQAAHLSDYRQDRPLLSGSRDLIHAVFRRPDSVNAGAGSHTPLSIMEIAPDSGKSPNVHTVQFARCFLRLAQLPNFALDRLSRYEANRWRQAPRILTHSRRLIAANRRSEGIF